MPIGGEDGRHDGEGIGVVPNNAHRDAFYRSIHFNIARDERRRQGGP